MAEKPLFPSECEMQGLVGKPATHHANTQTTWRRHYRSHSEVPPVLQIGTSTSQGTARALDKVHQKDMRRRQVILTGHYFAVYFQDVRKLTTASERFNTGTETGGNICQVPLG